VRIHLVALAAVALSFVLLGVSAQSPVEGPGAFVLSVDREGSLSVAAVRLDESSVVEQALAALRRDASTRLIVEADEGAPYESVEHAALLLQRAGATGISFRTKSAAQP
jgi:biopolymer transport protein ExbD